MPLIRNTEDWEKVFRKRIKSLRTGWTVRKSGHSNKIMLEIRTADRREGLTLDMKWKEDNAAKAEARIRRILETYLDGEHTLAQASKLAESDAPKLVEKLNWEEAKNNFKIYKTKFGNAIKEKLGCMIMNQF